MGIGVVCHNLAFGGRRLAVGRSIVDGRWWVWSFSPPGFGAFSPVVGNETGCSIAGRIIP